MKFIYSLFSVLFLISCSEQVREKENCPNLICTQEFRTVTVTYKDSAGSPVIVKDFSAIVRRTGEPTDTKSIGTINFKGNYTVATDNDTKSLLTKGDTIDVSAVNPKTNQKKTVQFVVSGGKCACHIEKISGPEEVVFE